MCGNKMGKNSDPAESRAVFVVGRQAGLAGRRWAGGQLSGFAASKLGAQARIAPPPKAGTWAS